MSGEITPKSESEPGSSPPAHESPVVQQNAQAAVPVPPWMQQFLENQTRELDLRFQQSKLDELKEQHAFEYSTKALDAQATYLAEEHSHGSGRFRGKCWLAGILTLLVLVFLSIVILSGNGQIALELIKVVVYGGLGAFGGYGYAKARKMMIQEPPGGSL